MGKFKQIDREEKVVLIVDDEDGIRSQLKWALSNEYRVLDAASTEKSLEILNKQIPNLVTLDITLSPYGDLDGIRVLEKIVKIDPKIKVIMITGHDERELALKAIQLGAYDYYQKPINIDEIRTIIKRALYIQKLELENEELNQKLQQEKQFKDIIGDSPQMQKVFDIMKKVLSTDVPVLISGESGTGKELVARAIHFQSPRMDKSFIPINCGAIPENLLESELFGHEKGAFTGAYYQRKGKFELANDGTVFLDEIGELSPKLQVKILRFLQEKEIERVGGKESITIDVRILAATNKNLKEEIGNQNFREDLYYRLAVITLEMPPLKERGDDVLLLANCFLAKYSKEYDKKISNFDAFAIKKMQNYSWPGNVRELENRIKRAVIMCQKSLITLEDLGFTEEILTKKESLIDVIDNIQKKYINMALNRTRGNISKTARELGINRVTLYDLLNRLNIDVNEYRKKIFQ